jgi:ATP-grasp ribosomal peptide maturase
MAVLILTQRLDPTADHVITELNARAVPVFRFDISDFPLRLSVSAELCETGWAGTMRDAGRVLGLSDVTGIYSRRPTGFQFPAEMSEAEQRWAETEGRMGVGGVLSAIRRWLNHPARIAAAEYKPVQLAAAVRAGLRTPKSIVTNDPSCAAKCAESVGQVIYKPLGASSLDEDGVRRMIYANLVRRDELANPAIRLTAHLFQEWVEHDYAVRLTVVDRRFFASAIYADSVAAHVDWRSDYSALRYGVVEPPEIVRRDVLALMEELELRFGALDFLVTPSGDWVFLEINPNGQWAWIEDQTGLPVGSAIADALTVDVI